MSRAFSGSGIPAEIRDIPLNTVRRALSRDCFARSAPQTFGWLAFDAALYAGSMWGIFGSDSWWAKLLFGIGAGCAVAFVFVWGHDAAHGARFRGKWTAAILGPLSRLPSLTMYRLGCYAHNPVHPRFPPFTPPP